MAGIRSKASGSSSSSSEQEAPRRSRGLTIEGVAIEGLSIGGHETCVIFPTMNLAFDIGRCPQRAISQDFLFISHAHMDHIGGLPMYVATRGLYSMKPPTIFVPKCVKEDVEKLFEVHRKMDQSELKHNLIGMDVGEEYYVRRDLKVRAFKTYHCIPSQGYVVFSVKQKLKQEYIGLPSNEIKSLKSSGVEITNTVTEPQVAFTGDTTSDFIVDNSNIDVLKARILVMESVKLFVRGKGKFGYLSGSTKKPKADDEGFERWESENSMIMSWLINSMEPEVGRTYLFLPSALEIWSAVKETYSDLGNAGQLFEIRNKLKRAKQGEKSVTQYYTDLKTLWQELDLFCEYQWSCPTDSALYQKMVEKERVFDFLAGLNKELDEVRGRILGREPLPSTREVFAEVRREESRRQVMLGTDSPLSAVETSALMTTKPESTPQRHQKRPICDYCHRLGHVKDKCWKLHGKPADFQPSKRSSRDNKGYQVSSEDTPVTSHPTDQSFFSKENLEQLFQMWNTHQSANSSSIPSSSLAQKGPVLGEDDWQC